MLRPFVLFGGSEELTFPSSEAVYRKKPFPVDLSCVSDPLSINGNAQGSVKSDGENQTAARDGENQTAARDGENQTAARDTANCQKITRNQGTVNDQNPSNEAGPDSNVGCSNGQSSNGQDQR